MRTNKTVIGMIRQICDDFDHTYEDDGTVTLERIQSIVNKQLGFAFVV